MKTIFLFALMSLLTARQASAESSRPFSEMKGKCDNYATDLSREMSLWGRAGKRAESGNALANDDPGIRMGEKAIVQLLPATNITVAAPIDVEKQKLYKGGYGGYVKFRAPKSGNYRLSAGAKAWIELLDGKKKPVDSYGFEMQTKCEKIFKVVNFHLKEGKTYFLQITGSEKGNLALLLTRAGKI